jgi:hypothetical protein
MDPSFTFWNEIENVQAFISDDAENPAREVACNIILKHAVIAKKPPRVLEIGPGIGRDFGVYFKHWEHQGLIKYQALEGSATFQQAMTKLHHTSSCKVGTFKDLRKGVCEVLYTKATLEHQPELGPALDKCLQAAKELIVITWYLPPSDKSETRYDAVQHMHYNRYEREAAIKQITQAKWKLVKIHPVPASGNEIWELRKD